MIPKIMHFCSKDFTWEERLIIKKNSKRAPGWQVKEWSDEMNERFIEKCYPQFIERYLNMPENVMRIDVVRCLYMHFYGGIYIDTDYIIKNCPDKDFLDAKIILGIEEVKNKAIGNVPKYGNAFLASEAGQAFWLNFVNTIFERFESGEDRMVYIGGPHALSKFVADNPRYMDSITVLKQSLVYPDFNWHKFTTQVEKNTFGAHLCWGSWRNKPLRLKIKNYGRRVFSALIN